MTVLHPPRTEQMSASLTDRYLDAVAHDLPRQRRDEVTARVRASIEADVGTRVAAGMPPPDAEWASLAERGDPKRVADVEAGPRWLIGPRLYPDYVRVLRIVEAVVLPLVAAVVALVSGLAGDNPLEVLASVLSAVVGAAVQVAFWVTVVFAVLDRRGVVLDGAQSAWSPADLPAAPRTDVGLGETIAGIAVQVLLIGLVLWPWQYWPSADGDPVPVIDLDLRPQITTLLVAVLVAGIALAAVTYRVGHWTVGLAATNTVLDVAFAGLVIWLVATGGLFDPAFVDALGDSPLLDPGQAEQAVDALGVLIGTAVGFACAADLIDGWRKALRIHAAG
jgi:hypothetical protein